ncbi:MAG: hypothetical protein JOZ46_02520 [Candidatus Dormibacteraeota bacterium]|nr:hypothetical protein [Candidatus Dormibacteraeota bacterium]MBV9524672.1 hypothetical protein [Candidatus Dormibacteraeota bacterium]
MKTNQNRRSHRMCSVIERMRSVTNSGTRAHNPGFSSDVSDRVGRLSHTTDPR